MDVRLPDGTIVTNVPDNFSQSDLTAKLAANGIGVAQPATSESKRVPGDFMVPQAVKDFGSKALELGTGMATKYLYGPAEPLVKMGLEKARESGLISPEQAAQYQPAEMVKSVGSGLVKGVAMDPIKAVANLGAAGAYKAGLITFDQLRDFSAKEKQLSAMYDEQLHPSAAAELAGATLTPLPGLGKLKAASKLARLAEPAIQGAILGGGYAAATDEVTKPEYSEDVLRGAELGAIVNPAVHGLTTTIGMGVAGAKKWIGSRFSGVEADYLNRLIENDPQLGLKTVEDIRAGRVPSSALYAYAQETLPKQAFPSEFIDRLRAKSKGLVDQLSNMASGVTGLVKRRASATSGRFQNFDKTFVKSDATLESILDRYNRAVGSSDPQAIAIIEQRPFQIGKYTPAQQVPVTGVGGKPLVGPDGQPIMTNVPAQYPKYTGATLDDIRKTMAGKINPPSPLQGVDPHMQKAIGDLRQELTEWMENKFPGWKATRTTFANYSKRIDQKKVAQELYRSLKNTLDENLPVDAKSFQNAIDNVLGTVKKSTGERRYTSLDELFSPKQMRTLGNIGEQITKQAHLEQRASAGLAAGAVTPVEKLQGLHLLSRPISILEGVLKAAGEKVSDKVKMKVAGEMMRDPAAAANSLEQAIGTKLTKQQRTLFMRRAAAVAQSAVSKPLSKSFYGYGQGTGPTPSLDAMGAKYDVNNPVLFQDQQQQQQPEPLYDMAEQYGLETGE